MKKSYIGVMLLSTALVVQSPFQAFATTTAATEQAKTGTTAPITLMDGKTLAATSDLELTIGKPMTGNIHFQDTEMNGNEWGSYIKSVDVTLTNMDGVDYNLEYGPQNEDGNYQYINVVLSGTPTKAGSGSINITLMDGVGNVGTYNYTANTQSTTTVEYVDENGTKLADDTVQAGDLNTSYTTSAKTIDGYTLDETKLPSNQNGQFGETNQTVTYTYTKNESEVNKGTVGISFYAEDGERQELVTSLDLSYAYPDGVPSNTVTFNDLANVATYNNLVNDGSVLQPDISWNDLLKNTIDYVQGNIDRAQFETNVGVTVDQFDLDYIANNFAGYEFDEAVYQENLAKMVIFEQNGGNVNLQIPFKKIETAQVAADVTVKYVDADGNELATSETLTGNVDDSYTSEAKTIEGWTLAETPANATGTFSDQAQTVTYVYTENTDNDNTSGDDSDTHSDDNSGIPSDDSTQGNDNTGSNDIINSNDTTDNSTDMKGDSSKLQTRETTTVNSQGKTATKTAKTAKESLPKTGDNAFQNSLLVGLGALLLSGLFAFMRRTRKAK
ncbi:MucBP domain-containing protein [Listeria immobilis]|uniref:MucBP domain-containing protein n=1 Tax=Listeria immobilis TaxID=2713502 RepID=A0ABR6SSK6_9LIST|nr:MucBP domain-containing protein [Listeria immobilis]MBC1482767.1 MucBP domain-containing protein [Listeria immobilis]MBC1506018.1 MucBP domain-containing protein [Listeria immobilis]MBC1508662.1 MucBP domain-containing protein [Listeria immobilis]MBC1515937.1 MucBP domain-containing protein [Listeria immobilis]MBC6303025.1 MucBP domain-containing protein [Listeria immobilis]